MRPSSSKQETTPAGSRYRERVLDRLGPGAMVNRLRTTSFWTAVALPFLYLPLLVSGIDGTVELTAFATLLLVNVVALVVGHPHHR